MYLCACLSHAYDEQHSGAVRTSSTQYFQEPRAIVRPEPPPPLPERREREIVERRVEQRVVQVSCIIVILNFFPNFPTPQP